jgi:predicted Fe-Mo cluster-binding NifX family protein
MRVAISADSREGLDSVVSPHFGRCPYFVLVDLDGQSVTAVDAMDNPFYAQHQPGQVPGFIHQQGANVMLTGGMGGRAISFFEQYGIEAVTGASGTVRHALNVFLGGGLTGAAPCLESQQHGHGEEPADTVYEKDEVGRLREEVEMLQQQLLDAEDRLEHLGDSE